MCDEYFPYKGKKWWNKNFQVLAKNLVENALEYEESRGKQDSKGMAWTVVKQALFGMSVFQVVTKGQQQQQGYFSL